MEEIRELRPIRSRSWASSVASLVKLAMQLAVLLPENLNLLLLDEDQRSDAGWCCQPIRPWNPGSRGVHHRRSLPEIQLGIKLPPRVQRGRVRNEPSRLLDRQGHCEDSLQMYQWMHP
ncbi:MAG: hypothetical protein ACK56F_07825, partial [bacterium]